MLDTNLNVPKIVPFYKTTEGLSKKTLHTLINNGLDKYSVIDYIPSYISLENKFIDKIHGAFPPA